MNPILPKILLGMIQSQREVGETIGMWVIRWGTHLEKGGVWIDVLKFFTNL